MAAKAHIPLVAGGILLLFAINTVTADVHPPAIQTGTQGASAIPNQHHGQTLADLPPRQRANALVALGAAEDAEGLLGPNLFQRTFGKIGGAIKRGSMAVARGVVWVISGGQITIPEPTKAPTYGSEDGRSGQPSDAGTGSSRGPLAYELSGKVAVGYVDDESGEVTPASKISADASVEHKQLLVRINRFYIAKYPGRPPYHLFLYISPIKARDLGDTGAESKQAEESPMFAFVAEEEQAPVARLRGIPLFSIRDVSVGGVSANFRVDQVKRGFFKKLFDGFIHFAAIVSAEAIKAGGLIPVGWHAKEANEIIKDIDIWMKKRGTRPILDTSFSLAISAPGHIDRLRPGLYVMVQADPETFEWNSVRYLKESGALTSSKGPAAFNYVVLGFEAVDQPGEHALPKSVK